MQQLAVVGRLKPDSETTAKALIEAGPPFDPEVVGLGRHAIYLSSGEVVFVFEGPDVESVVGDIIDDPFRSPALTAWTELLDGSPRIARVAYSWDRRGGGRNSSGS